MSGSAAGSGEIPKAVAVLGGRGLLGREVVAKLAAGGAHVVSIDRAPAPADQEPDTPVVQLRSDVLTPDWWPHIAECDVLVNLVGTGDHARSRERPGADYRDNCETAIAVLEAARAAGIKHVCYASTRQVYGAPVSLPVTESHPVRPIDLNAVHRYAAELYHGVYARQYDISYSVLRLTNLYGPGLRLDAPMFLAQWLAAASRGEPFDVWGGDQIRDLLYVEDAARALVAALPHASRAGTTLNCGGAEPATLLEIATRLAALGLQHRVVPYPSDRAPMEIGDFVSGSTLMSRLTGWKPEITLDEGLRRTVEATVLPCLPPVAGISERP